MRAPVLLLLSALLLPACAHPSPFAAQTQVVVVPALPDEEGS